MEKETAAAAVGGGLFTWFGKWLSGRKKEKNDLVKMALLMVEGWQKYAQNMEAALNKRIVYLEGVVIKLEKRIAEQDKIIYDFTHGKSSTAL